MSNNLLSIKNLSIGIKKNNQNLIAVDDISFDIEKGEILGIVGESGCGKSITALSILGLLPESISIVKGSILFDKKDIVSIKEEELRKMQGNDLTIVFQEPMTSLNPLMKIGKQVGEVLQLHKNISRVEVKKEVLNVLKKVGINDIERCYNAYPHQLSGGMRQRVIIAMAIICKPKLLIADEPTTSLDVVTQAQILDLLFEIHREYNTSILFISHDLEVIKRICDRMLVMYYGKIIEIGTVNDVFSSPLHEYTKGLIASVPTVQCKGMRLSCIEGKVPRLEERKTGCPFALRCKKANDICFKEDAPPIVYESNHSASCHFVDMKGVEKYVAG